MSHTPSTFITGDVVGLDIADSGGSDNQFIDGAFSSRNAPHEFFVNAYEVQALNLTNTWSRALGTVPYVGQLKILDLSKSKPEANKLRGFWSGFAMRGPLDVSGEHVLLALAHDESEATTLVAWVVVLDVVDPAAL